MTNAIDPAQFILSLAGRTTNPFPPNSRYFGLGTATRTTVDGKKVIYLLRRFLPPPERFALLQTHTVKEGDRLDNVTAQYLGDPEQFWRLCDANRAMHPDELTEVWRLQTSTPGAKLRIPLPEGIPGTEDD
jgi:hypothetical protein